MELKRVVIVGAGAVGGSIGGLLCEAGYSVALLARGQHAEKIRESGLLVRMPDRTIIARPTVIERIEQLTFDDGDVILFATKLQDIQPLMDQVLQHAGANARVVCATNGIHGEHWAGERFDNVGSMLVWMPASYLIPGEVSLYSGDFRGVLDIGPADGSLDQQLLNTSEQLCAWLRDAGFDSVARSDIQRWKYAKWITNLGNAAQAFVSDDWKSIARMAQAEGELVLSAASINRVSVEELLARCKSVQMLPIDGLPRQGGSSWQSFHRGQTMETRWIEGAMADLAAEHGVAAPVNDFFRALAKDPRKVTADEVRQV